MASRVNIPRPYIRPLRPPLPPVEEIQPPINEWNGAVAISEYVVHADEFTHDGHRYVSLTKLASDVGISLSHLSRIFTHQRNPSIAVAIRLAAAMGVTLDRLVEQLGLA